MPHDHLIAVQDLVIRYNISGNLVPVVNQVSFYIEQNEIVALVGESGCGKTQIALSLAGLLSKNAIVQQKSKNDPKTAMIFQDPLNALNPVMKVGKQILEGFKAKEKRNRENVVKLLGQVGIDEPYKRYDQYPHEFSGGMRQRALIAMALAQEPDLLIADEPTTALDVTIQAQIIDLLKELNNRNGLSILFISHDLSLVKSFAHRTLVMYAGRIVESAKTEPLFNFPKHPYTKALLDVASLSKKNGSFITIDGSVADPLVDSSGCPFYPRCNVAEVECRSVLPSFIIENNHSWLCIHD